MSYHSELDITMKEAAGQQWHHEGCTCYECRLDHPTMERQQRPDRKPGCAGFGERKCDADGCANTGVLWFIDAFGDKFCREHKNLLKVQS